MSEPTNRLLANFLGSIERAEAALLSWGLVDGFSTEQELIDRAEDFLGTQDAWHLFSDGLSVLDAMVERGLVFRWNAAGDTRYRTRLERVINFSCK